MSRTAKRGISNAAAMAACAVCLVAAAVIVMVPLLAPSSRHADQPPPFHALVDRVLSVSTDAAWDAARVSALADPARAGQLADMGRVGRLDAGSLLGVHVPADARRDACANSAMALPRMRVPHAGGHAAAIPAVGAEWHGSVSSTRLGRPVDALGQRLPVESAVRNQVHPTSLSAHGKFRALGAGHLRDRAAQLRAAARASEPDTARGPSPSPEKWTPEVSDHIRSIFVGCSLVA
jgi:hypothetical protein